MGTQKYRLDETVLLSTQNTCFNWWQRKLSDYYAKKVSYEDPLFYVSSQEITVQQLMAHISSVKKDMIILEKSEFTMIRNDTEVSLDQALR